MTNPLGVDAREVRLSWHLATTDAQQRGQRQSAYRVRVATSQEALLAQQGDAWDSGKVLSDATLHIPYEGGPLRSQQRYWWAVCVWDAADEMSDWSAPAWWEMGLLTQAEWQAQFIGLRDRPLAQDLPVVLPNPQFSPAPLALPAVPCLRKTFTVTQPLAQARLYVTARGVYEMHLNGHRVHHTLLSPGWTEYQQRLLYQTYDVTDYLALGDNVVSALVGDGWYSGYVGYLGQRDGYGATPQLLAQLHLTYADGSTALVATDATWRGATGPLLAADLLQGEHVDARQWWPGWERPDFADHLWQPVVAESLGPLPRIVADTAPPVRITQEIAPQSIIERAPGHSIVDFGQNLVGWVRLRMHGDAGQRVVLRFAEMLDATGDLYRANLRSASATDSYVLRGDGPETFEPRFTFHGFRYCEILGYPGTMTTEAIRACVIESDNPVAGTLSTGHPLVNQLHRNVVWGQRSNFLSVPTDCPQRDERLGWLGDAQIFARSATYNRDVAAFFTRWLDTVADAQGTNGAFPDVAPRLVVTADGSPAWGDAGVLLPWTLYEVYGDQRILARHWAAMERWMAYVGEANPDGLWQQRRNLDYGDWLTTAEETPKDVVATAFYAHSAQVMARIASVLGHTEAATRYDVLFHHIRAAFIRAYVSADGRVRGETQAAYALALQFDLLPVELRASAAQHLVASIAAADDHITAGFLGIRHLLPALSEAGYDELAYRLLLQETYPSWGYSIRQGATTIWERWDGWTEAQGFQDPDMNSFNHYSLGSVDEWLFRYAAGIDTHGQQGYHHIRIHPHPDPRLGSLDAVYLSAAGRIRSAWAYTSAGLTLDVEIPVNAQALLVLPASPTEQVWEGHLPIAQAGGIVALPQEGTPPLYHLASGHYAFRIGPKE